MTMSMSCATRRAIALHPGAMADARGMTLGGRRHILVAVVDHPHRAARLPRQHRSVAGKHVRVFLLPPNPPPVVV